MSTVTEDDAHGTMARLLHGFGSNASKEQWRYAKNGFVPGPYVLPPEITADFHDFDARPVHQRGFHVSGWVLRRTDSSVQAQDAVTETQYVVKTHVASVTL